MSTRTVPARDIRLLAFAVISVITGVLLARVLPFVDIPWASTAAALALWAGLAAPVALFFARSRPEGLLSFRATDVVWGLGAGAGLRLLQGALERADLHPFPSLPAAGGPFSGVWWLEQGLAAGVVAPVTEELFFRAVILVTVYRMLLRRVGPVAAAVTALLCSAGGFVLLHVAFATLPAAATVQLFLIGAACASIVLLTGRVWGAVLAHVVYNVSYLGLGVIGTYLS